MDFRNKRKFIKEYIITSIVSLIVGTGLFLFFYFVVDRKGIPGAIDGTGITGLILVCAGLLIFVNREGFFDVFSYGFRQMGSMLFKKSANEYNDYPGYVQFKKGIRQKKSKYYLFIILVGLLFVTAFIILEVKFGNTL